MRLRKEGFYYILGIISGIVFMVVGNMILFI